MCIVFVAFQAHPEYPLIVASNRDEFFARPTEVAHRWNPWINGEKHETQILAGRDMEGDGTWLGVEKASGRFAVLTNVRDPEHFSQIRESRGHLVTDFLTSSDSPQEVLQRFSDKHDNFNPYNLLVATPLEAWFYSCTEEGPRPLQPGIYALSNATLDTPWPKVHRGKEKFSMLLKSWTMEVGPEPFFKILRDSERAPDQYLPDTGVPLEWERLLSSIFIRDETGRYGTRQSTIYVVNNEFKAHYRERTFDKEGVCQREHAFCMNLGL